jgi:cytochrome c peroxidase
MHFRVMTCLLILVCGGLLFVHSCAVEDHDKKAESGRRKKELPPPGTLSALPATYLSPTDNPGSPEKIELGRLLFYDPILSGNKDVACASCHHPEFGYAESLPLSIGVNGQGLGEKRRFSAHNDIPFTRRNSQSLLNAAFIGINEKGEYQPEKAPMFWDLRAGGLEQQAMFPVKTFEEMRGPGFTEENIAAEIEGRLKKIPGYRKRFAAVFGDHPITADNISKALAAFQRSLVANNSRFDLYMRGDKSALSTREIEGMQLFLSVGCARCHSGPMLSDFKTHVLGVVDNEQLNVSDSGFQNTYAFRTPSLRNLRFSRPYMHNGKIRELKDVMTFYEDLPGKDVPNKNVRKDQVDTLARMLKLEFRDINTILEFLNTLNDDKYDRVIPAAVPSGLPVGGRIK